MAISERIWDASTTVIKVNDKVEWLAEAVKTQQQRIGDRTVRVVRLETGLEIALASRGTKKIVRRPIGPD